MTDQTASIIDGTTVHTRATTYTVMCEVRSPACSAYTASATSTRSWKVRSE